MKTDDQRASKKFEVGDVVVKFHRRDFVIRKVAKSLKRYVVLSDGSKYSHIGEEYPAERGTVFSTYIIPATPDHIAVYKKRMRWSGIEKKFNELKERSSELKMDVLNSLFRALESASNKR